jgi:hypothetical protein
MRRERDIGFFVFDFARTAGAETKFIFQKKALHFPARRVEIVQAGNCSNACRLDDRSVPHDQVVVL